MVETALNCKLCALFMIKIVKQNGCVHAGLTQNECAHASLTQSCVYIQALYRMGVHIRSL